MNKQTYSTLVTVAVLLLAGVPLAAQDTFFFTDFEYADEPFPEDLESAASLNGAEGQIGEWSGDDFPAGDPSSFFWLDESDPVCCGFADNPDDGGRLLHIDRPIANATFLANLTEEIPVIGTQVSFVVGTRRTGGGGTKDYDVFGLDSDGNESFRVRIGTGSFERLGFVSNGTASFDLPTAVGEDADGDLSNIGAPPLVEMMLSTVTLNLSSQGFIVDFENSQNSYATELLANNGTATNLAQVGISYQSVEGSTGAQPGFYLDTLSVSREDLLFGDFDDNGKIEMADFQILAANYGTGTTYAEGDFNLDRRVSLEDFAGFVTAFNAQAPAAGAAVPEPNSAILCVGAIVLFVGRRRQRKTQ